MKQQSHFVDLVIDPGLFFSLQPQRAFFSSFVLQIHRHGVEGTGQLPEFILRLVRLQRAADGAAGNISGDLHDPVHAARNIPQHADNQKNRQGNTGSTQPQSGCLRNPVHINARYRNHTAEQQYRDQCR
ncbi:hypothetical protein HYD27_30555 [Paenibacillus sp. S150]|nr:hypothetical protein [Paenibacillus sp. S150]MBW4085672.1 hypothetical protein [Paenibacillus sp. S150]